MIQRIQSVYLLLVTVLLVVAICMPVGQFIGADGVTAHVFKPLGVALADGGFQSTWGLFGILLLSALVAFCTIFLFRNRMLQIRMTIFSSILLIGYYIAFCVFMFILKGDLDATAFQLGWALCLPVVAYLIITKGRPRISFGIRGLPFLSFLLGVQPFPLYCSH